MLFNFFKLQSTATSTQKSTEDNIKFLQGQFSRTSSTCTVSFHSASELVLDRCASAGLQKMDAARHR